MIAYGFDATALLVWLRPIDPADDRNNSGVLCTRHADAMVLPRDWTLDDARDVVPRLFAARHDADAAESATSSAAAPRRRPVRPRQERASTQLHLEPVLPIGTDHDGDAVEPELAGTELAGTELTVTELTGVSSTPDPDATTAIPWRPDFDADDDLDGALDAATPLLSRAFRAGARRRP